jgi:uncharacterized protein YrrD
LHIFLAKLQNKYFYIRGIYMQASKKIAGLPIINLENGELLGKVKGILINPIAHSIGALVLEQKANLFRDARLIPYGQIENIGESAVTVPNKAAVIKASSSPDLQKLLRHSMPLIGEKVMTVGGKLLGIIHEYYFDPEDGRLVSIDLEGSFLESIFKGKTSLYCSSIKTIGKQAVIIDTDYQPSLSLTDSNFVMTWKGLKGSSSSLWQRTKTTTKKLGEKFEQLANEGELDLKTYEKNKPQEDIDITPEVYEQHSMFEKKSEEERL